MGDFFDRVVDVEATLQEAPQLASRVVDWLVGEGVLLRETTPDGVYSLGVEVGHLPGPEWGRAVSDASSARSQPGPVAVIVGRGSYCEGQGMDEPDSVSCPRCGANIVVIDYPNDFEPDPEVWEPFSQAIDAWKETGRGQVECPSCLRPVPVTDWIWAPGFALGNLAFDFWGWPELSPAFLRDLRERLGHKTEEHSGKF